MHFHATLSILLIVAAAIGINAMPAGDSTVSTKHRVRDLRVRNPFVFEEAPALEGAAYGAAQAA
jgi:hypothetical protein